MVKEFSQYQIPEPEPKTLDDLFNIVGNTAYLTGGGIASGDFVNGKQGIMISPDGVNIGGIGKGSLISIQGWQFDGTFSATNYRVVAWTAGTITLTDGITFSISAGNTGNMAAVTYIYFDKAASETELQTTTTASDAVGANKILIAVAQNNTDTNKKAIFQVFGGTGGMNPLITADNIAANVITANEIAANTITSGQITTGEFITLSAQIKDAIITSAKISSINADTITAGTLTGRTVQTASSGQRVVMDGSNNVLQIYDASSLRMQLSNQYLFFTGGAANDGVELYQSGYRQMTMRTPVTSVAFDTGGFYPTGGTLDLGGSASANRWNYVYANRYYIGSTRKDDVWDAKESGITAGTTAQYWRGDKSWQTLLGETSTTAYRGDYGKAAYDLRHARSHDHSASDDGNLLYPGYISMSGRIRLWNNNGYPTTDLAEGQMYYHTGEVDIRVRRGTSWADLCWYDERNVASPLPTAKNAIDQLKEIKGPTVSEDGLAFNTEDFPKEFHMTTSNKTLHTNLLPVIGMLLKSQKELVKKVEELENKLK